MNHNLKETLNNLNNAKTLFIAGGYFNVKQLLTLKETIDAASNYISLEIQSELYAAGRNAEDIVIRQDIDELCCTMSIDVDNRTSSNKTMRSNIEQLGVMLEDEDILI